MYDVVLDTTDLPVADLIARLRQIISGVNGQSAFASLSTLTTALATKVDTLETCEGELTTAKNTVTAKVLLRDDAQAAAEEDAKKLASEVGKIAPSEDVIVLANLRIKSKPGPRPVPSQPVGLELTVGDEEGELTGQCEGQPGVVDYYEIQYTTSDPNGPNPNWQHADTSKKSAFELKNLPSGQKVWVRLRAVNARGKSPWCDAACKRVP